jgi:predicted negative regulator of RcsB-dependent stress response
VGSEPGPAEGEAGEGDEAAPVPNRAARRAEASQRRKKRKTATDAAVAKTTDDEADEALPRDKNARAKELLKRRREQASGDAGERGTRPIQLLPGEMVDDALARSSSAVSKWIRDNFGIIQWVILGALAAGGGYLFYESRVDSTVATASTALMAGVRADRSRVMAEDKRSDEEKEADPSKVYKTVEERNEAALASYKKVIAEHGGTHAATLARLGEAGDYLDKRDWDHALEGYSAVSSSTLAGADTDVKVRALEGLAFAKEGKGDLDGALTAFKEIEGVDGRGNKELGLYHQGRVWLAKGDKDKAKDLLKQAHDKLEQPSTEGESLRYLKQMTDETLRRIDPSLVPDKAPVIGGPKGGSMSADELDKLRRKYEEMMKKQQQQEKH